MVHFVSFNRISTGILYIYMNVGKISSYIHFLQVVSPVRITGMERGTENATEPGRDDTSVLSCHLQYKITNILTIDAANECNLLVPSLLDSKILNLV